MKNTPRQVPASVAAAMTTQRPELFANAAYDMQARLLEVYVTPESALAISEIIRLLGDVVEENGQLIRREQKFKDEMLNAARSIFGTSRRLDRVAAVGPELPATEIDEAIRQMAEGEDD